MRARVFLFAHVLLQAACISATFPITGAVITILCLVLLGGHHAAADGILHVLATRFTTSETRATRRGRAQTVVAVAWLISSAGFGILWFVIGRERSTLDLSIVIAITNPERRPYLAEWAALPREFQNLIHKQRPVLLGAISAVAVKAEIVFGALSFLCNQSAANVLTAVETTPVKTFTRDRVKFRNTASGRNGRMVAILPLDNLSGPRSGVCKLQADDVVENGCGGSHDLGRRADRHR